MAKGKQAAALFEVIHSMQTNRPSLLATPKWWFKRLTRTPGQSVPSNTSESQPIATIASDHEPTASRPERSSGIGMQLDRDRHVISFRMSFTSAIVGGFAVVVCIGLAYLIGAKINRGPAAATASPPIAQIKSGAPQPDVLKVAGTSDSSSSTSQPPQNRIVPNPGTSAPTAISSNGRVVGYNYVVIQSYPEEKTAKEARDALVKAGVNCTIEQKLRGLNPTWYSVVSADGFAKISSTEYQAFIQRLQQVSNQFAGKRSFKAFQPMPYKWDKSV